VVGTPAAEVVSTGDSLVFTLSYFVPRTPITKEEMLLQLPKKLPAPVDGESVTTKLTAGASAPFTAGSVTWAGLAQKNKFSAGEEPVVTIVLNAKEGYEFGSALTSGTTTFAAGEIAENGEAKVKYNLGTSLEIIVDYSTDGVLKKLSGNSLGLAKGNDWPTSLSHDTDFTTALTATATAGIANLLNPGGVVVAWTDGINNKKVDRSADDAKVTATITLKPASTYTFKGYSVSSSDKNTNIPANFTIGNIKPDVTVNTADGGGAGVADLVVTLVYSDVPKAEIADTVITTAKVGDIASITASSTKLSEAVWTLGTIIAATDPFTGTVAPVTAVNSGGSVASSATLAAGDVITVTMTFTAKDNYQFAAAVEDSSAVKTAAVGGTNIKALGALSATITLSDGDTVATLVVKGTVQ
jgi:hypothetical protein